MQSLVRQYLEHIKSFSRNEPQKIEFNLFEKGMEQMKRAELDGLKERNSLDK